MGSMYYVDLAHDQVITIQSLCLPYDLYLIDLHSPLNPMFLQVLYGPGRLTRQGDFLCLLQCPPGAEVHLIVETDSLRRVQLANGKLRY